MDWGRMLLLGDVGQQIDVTELREELERLTTRLGMERALREGADEMIGRLRRENNEVKLYLAAVVRLLVSRKVVSPAEIRQIVEALDREDGSSDGAYEGPLAPE